MNPSIKIFQITSLSRIFSLLDQKRIYIKLRCFSIVVSAFLTISYSCAAQQKIAEKNLSQSIALIDSAFKHSNIDNFNKAVAIESLKGFYASIATEKYTRKPGKSKIISITTDSAYVLLSGLVLYGNSGDETNFSNNYTGIYKFEQIEGTWKPTQKIGMDRANQIKRQNLGMSITPGKGIEVADTLTIDINDLVGFSVKLNHRARINKLLLNGSKKDFIFSGGLLWIKGNVKKGQKLIINYLIDVEKDENNRNSGYFSDAYGHLRNQYYWHPFFGFSSPNDRADFTLYCTIPKAYHVATSLPQKETEIGNLRVIAAKSEIYTFGLSLYYDMDWQVSTVKKDQIEMVIYATKDFLPGREVLQEQFSKDYDTLQKYFGKPIGNYLGIVQDRSSGNGWKNRSNNMVVAGVNGSMLLTDKPNPRAVFGHEIAHGWTSPAGPATNFLMEGWATYAESLLLSSVYGNSIITPFFASQKRNYLDGKFEGNRSLWEDYSNGGVSYGKGAWLFYMLENQLGREKLSTSMKNFIKSGNQSIQSFITEITKVAGMDMQPFLLPWLKSRQIPELSVLQSANSITIRQEGDIFMFPLEMNIVLKNGTSFIKTLNISEKQQTFQISDNEIEGYIPDPGNKLLFNIRKKDKLDN